MSVTMRNYSLKYEYEEINYLIEAVLEILPNYEFLNFVTIIPRNQNFEIGKLSDFDIKNCKRRLSRHLDDCDISFSFGLIEFCTKEYKYGEDTAIMWMPHIHLICLLAKSKEETVSILKAFNRRSKYNNGQTVVIKPVDNLDKLIGYITKNPSERGRVSQSFRFGKVISRHGRLPKIHRTELEQYLGESSELPDGAGSPILARGVMRRGDRWVPATSKKR